MNARDWRPVDLPNGAGGMAERCKDCDEPRRMLADLIRSLDVPGRSNVRIRNRGYNIDRTDIRIHCDYCGDLGWILSPELRELLRLTRDLIDQVAKENGPQEAPEPNF